MRVLPLLFLLAAGCDVAKSDGRSTDPTILHNTKIFRAQLEIEKFEAELDQYHAIHGEWAEDWGALRRSGNDPWGFEYLFDVEEGQSVVFSVGPDGREGTGDDVYRD